MLHYYYYNKVDFLKKSVNNLNWFDLNWNLNFNCSNMTSAFDMCSSYDSDSLLTYTCARDLKFSTDHD